MVSTENTETKACFLFPFPSVTLLSLRLPTVCFGCWQLSVPRHVLWWTGRKQGRNPYSRCGTSSFPGNAEVRIVLNLNSETPCASLTGLFSCDPLMPSLNNNFILVHNCYVWWDCSVEYLSLTYPGQNCSALILLYNGTEMSFSCISDTDSISVYFHTFIHTFPLHAQSVHIALYLLPPVSPSFLYMYEFCFLHPCRQAAVGVRRILFCCPVWLVFTLPLVLFHCLPTWFWADVGIHAVLLTHHSFSTIVMKLNYLLYCIYAYIRII